ncbi:alpha-hydroxy acid oxidase [Pseudomonas sp. PD9R]|uniref:alpha-hydroxy acid oxidase n=1 Tax=Pseudomonas sp. PD9R TaxID=2853534 RepID=UPI001C497543|nr:alpha-hydroxy acid oxidase [Pseudomonas sp. PD9R]MBV6826520.1 alpha-hydroxy-acid oxidizing protein [Pseudomonas sp. PD9R]
MAPTGAAGLLWYHGEAALARAANVTGIPYCLAMSSITPLDVVRREARGQLWLQLYLSPDAESNRAMIERARHLHFDALIVTVDTVVSPNREYNWRNGFNLPIKVNRRNALDLVIHPRWTLGVIGRYLLNEQMPRMDPIKRDERAEWSAIKRIRDLWSGPLVIKGIGCTEDALAALQTGADAIVLSNHGARNLDSASSPLALLPEVARRVAGRLPIWVDSGFMRGSDIFKALASGASAVLIGRAALYGLAAGGEAGATRSLALLREELDRCMAYAGVRTIAEIGPQHLQSDALATTV